MAKVILTVEAQKEFDALPVVIRIRIQSIIRRLAKWPTVSGAKPLRGDLAGQFRIRTGDYRLRFSAAGDTVTITKIGHRRDVYDD